MASSNKDPSMRVDFYLEKDVAATLDVIGPERDLSRPALINEILAEWAAKHISRAARLSRTVDLTGRK